MKYDSQVTSIKNTGKILSAKQLPRIVNAAQTVVDTEQQNTDIDNHTIKSQDNYSIRNRTFFRNWRVKYTSIFINYNPKYCDRQSLKPIINIEQLKIAELHLHSEPSATTRRITRDVDMSPKMTSLILELLASPSEYEMVTWFPSNNIQYVQAATLRHQLCRHFSYCTTVHFHLLLYRRFSIKVKNKYSLESGINMFSSCHLSINYDHALVGQCALS